MSQFLYPVFTSSGGGETWYETALPNNTALSVKNSSAVTVNLVTLDGSDILQILNGDSLTGTGLRLGDDYIHMVAGADGANYFILEGTATYLTASTAGIAPSLHYGDNSGTYAIAVKSPDTLSASKTLTLPEVNGTLAAVSPGTGLTEFFWGVDIPAIVIDGGTAAATAASATGIIMDGNVTETDFLIVTRDTDDVGSSALQLGTGYTVTSGASGALYLYTGNAAGNSGNLNLSTGTSGGTRGYINFNNYIRVDKSSAAVTSFGSDFYGFIVNGANADVAANQGSGMLLAQANLYLSLITGDINSALPSSHLWLSTGGNAGTGSTGTMYFYTGNANSGSSGDMSFVSGDSVSDNSGTISFTTGAAGGVRGAVNFDASYISFSSTDFLISPNATSNPSTTADGSVYFYNSGGTYELRVYLNGGWRSVALT